MRIPRHDSRAKKLSEEPGKQETSGENPARKENGRVLFPGLHGRFLLELVQHVSNLSYMFSSFPSLESIF